MWGRNKPINIDLVCVLTDGHVDDLLLHLGWLEALEHVLGGESFFAEPAGERL